MEQVKDIPKVKLNTSLHPAWGCAIGNVGVEGNLPGALDSFLFDKYKIHAVGIDMEHVKGVRITPNIYTSTKDLDVLIEAIAVFAKG
jgi:selenocysteine lyase/cysteine desulfurase